MNASREQLRAAIRIADQLCAAYPSDAAVDRLVGLLAFAAVDDQAEVPSSELEAALGGVEALVRAMVPARTVQAGSGSRANVEHRVTLRGGAAVACTCEHHTRTGARCGHMASVEQVGAVSAGGVVPRVVGRMPLRG